jgi:hypothetical protein
LRERDEMEKPMDIWNDPDGVWLEHDKTLYGPYGSEMEAEEQFKRLTEIGEAEAHQ